MRAVPFERDAMKCQRARRLEPFDQDPVRIEIPL